MLAWLVWASPVLAQSEQPAREAFGRITGLPAYVLRPYQFAVPGQAGSVRLEVRFGLVNDLLQFVKEDDNRYTAAYEAALTLFNQAGVFAGSRTWKRRLYADDFAATNDRLHLNAEQATFIVPGGRYELRLEIVDLDTRKRLQRNYPLTLNDYAGPGLQLSALALGYRGSADDSLRYNFAALLTSPAEHQGLYFEIYGAQPGDTLHLAYTITDWRNVQLESWTTDIIPSAATVRHFEPLDRRIKYQGPQNLAVRVSRPGGSSDTARGSVDYRVNLPSFDEERGAADCSKIPDGALEYISTGDEYKRLGLAGVGAQRDSLIAAFWRARDPSPNTPANELREEFCRRVAFADNRFSIYGIDKAGWETDRGRIYIVYGPPQEVHHRLEEAESSPYEVWLYPQHSRYFVFRDKDGSGDFKLVNR